jgi:hypothetical protein
MVSHSGQEGRLQVLEVSSRAGLGCRGSGVPGQGHAVLENSSIGSGAFGRKEAR